MYLKEKPKQLIILGGGASIKEGISKGLWKKLDGKFVIGCNYSFNYYISTIQCYLDDKFFDEQKEALKKLPLIITKPHQKQRMLNNQIMIKITSNGSRDLTKGVYKGSLTGIFALSIGRYLLDKGEIFLLGYDFGAQGNITASDGKTKKGITHFYQGELNHRGIGKVNYYNASGRAERDFSFFAREKKIKIYNVSLNSSIPTFTKISYDDFLKKLDNKTYCQSWLRAYTKVLLSKIGYAKDVKK